MRTHLRVLLLALSLVILSLPCFGKETIPGEWIKVEKDGITIMCEKETRDLAEQLLPEISKRLDKNRKEGTGAQVDSLVKQRKRYFNL